MVSGISVDIKSADLKKFTRKLNKFAQKIKDLRSYFEEAGRNFLEEERGIFLHKVPTGKPWANLKPATWKRKKTKHIMRESNTLFKSLTKRGAKGNIFHITPSNLTVGTAISYAIFHQKGTKKMPKREVVTLSKGLIRRWTLAMSHFVARRKREGGLS